MDTNDSITYPQALDLIREIAMDAHPFRDMNTSSKILEDGIEIETHETFGIDSKIEIHYTPNGKFAVESSGEVTTVTAKKMWNEYLEVLQGFIKE